MEQMDVLLHFVKATEEEMDYSRENANKTWQKVLTRKLGSVILKVQTKLGKMEVTQWTKMKF